MCVISSLFSSLLFSSFLLLSTGRGKGGRTRRASLLISSHLSSLLFSSLPPITQEEEPEDDARFVVKYLMDLPVTNLYRDMKRQDPDLKKYSYLPYMATHGKPNVGSLMSESYCERMGSCGALLIDKLSTKLNTSIIDKKIVLKMNKEFMDYMRKNYPRTQRKKRRVSSSSSSVALS